MKIFSIEQWSYKKLEYTKFSSNYSEIEHLNVINGMGVTLGDSIVGISVLSAIKKRIPRLKLRLFDRRLHRHMLRNCMN
jgi:hypothetical protein